VESILSPLTNYQSEIVLPGAQKNANGKAITKNFKMATTGTLAFVPNSPSCGSGNIEVIIQGTGNGTHLGLYTIYLTYCSDGTNPLSPPAGIQTAANGDQLNTMMVGAGMDPVLGYYMDFQYSGGTGRFANVIGSVRLYQTIDYVNLTFSNYGFGTLTY
jgi:hypothetical protein